ncbi:hypothetical protein [Pedobacter sp. SYSU D00535]|uniref:hypothetical protein n=1 Tax=Pedobacter sp. SYSU D00535 TaxID=2810308 RepID=UPI001A9659DF|nr:hypothetical protein [Pedobacter sp. SYSU D00535]
MSAKYKIRDQQKLYFVSFAVVYWLDVFIRNEYRALSPYCILAPNHGDACEF